jgi:hypothetical protein
MQILLAESRKHAKIKVKYVTDLSGTRMTSWDFGALLQRFYGSEKEGLFFLLPGASSASLAQA